MKMETDKKKRQIDIIKRRYRRAEYNVVHDIDKTTLLSNLRKVIDPSDFEDKVVLEIGAGCSLYLPLFLEFGCKKLVANDLVEERLKLNKIDDERYVEVLGDFLEVDFEEEKFDVVFASLTLMFVIPMLDEFFSKIYRLLKAGGVLVTYDPNFLCPVSIYRYFVNKNDLNPTCLFNPFKFVGIARKEGLKIEKMVPFTSNFEWTSGRWLIGTSFWMKAIK